jgi:hypothetical protein
VVINAETSGMLLRVDMRGMLRSLITANIDFSKSWTVLDFMEIKMILMFPARQFLSTWWLRRYVPPKRRFLQESRSVASQKTAFFLLINMFTAACYWFDECCPSVNVLFTASWRGINRVLQTNVKRKIFPPKRAVIWTGRNEAIVIFYIPQIQIWSHRARWDGERVSCSMLTAF